MNEDMADYFDDRMHLRPYIFDGNTSQTELILDILDSLPEFMLPSLKGSIAMITDRDLGE